MTAATPQMFAAFKGFGFRIYCGSLYPPKLFKWTEETCVAAGANGLRQKAVCCLSSFCLGYTNAPKWSESTNQEKKLKHCRDFASQ